MDRNDEEQLATLRDWWQRNGASILTGLVIAVVGASGWWGYEFWQERTAQQSAAAYGEFMQVAQRGDDLDAMAQAAENLQNNHTRSGYAVLASLQLARHQMEAGQHEDAVRTLSWAADNAEHDALRNLARLREARALAAADRIEDALARLETSPGPGFVGAFSHLRGDLLSAMDEHESAISAYRSALDADDLDADARDLVRTRLQSLGEEV